MKTMKEINAWRNKCWTVYEDINLYFYQVSWKCSWINAKKITLVHKQKMLKIQKNSKIVKFWEVTFKCTTKRLTAITSIEIKWQTETIW